MYYEKSTTIKWVEVTNLKGDTYYLLPELLEDDGSGGFELGPSPITDSMEKAWELYWELLLEKLETDDPKMAVPAHYMQHIMNCHGYLKGDLEAMDAARIGPNSWALPIGANQ